MLGLIKLQIPKGKKKRKRKRKKFEERGYLTGASCSSHYKSMDFVHLDIRSNSEI
jgi:hypothetical protein